jgi:hypothetical protein
MYIVTASAVREFLVTSMVTMLFSRSALAVGTSRSLLIHVQEGRTTNASLV